MLKEHFSEFWKYFPNTFPSTFSVVKILAQILLVVSIVNSKSKGGDRNCPTGICIPAKKCPEAQVEGFDDYCSIEPLKACCLKPKDNFGQSPSGLACKKNSFKLCNGTLFIAGASSREAKKNEFPYMVQVGRINDKIDKKKFDCGGTLIHEKYVLTASHCINVVDNETLYVRLGGYNRTDGIIIEVNDSIQNDIENVEEFDIALLELKRPVEFNNNIMPACLPRTNGFEIKNFTAIGWGFNSKYDTLPTNLMKIVLTQVDSTRCEDVFKKVDNKTIICASGPNGTGDVCEGDSGGPLAITHPESCLGQVYGVVGGGKHCASEGSSSRYARVFAYLEWIERIVWDSD